MRELWHLMETMYSTFWSNTVTLRHVFEFRRIVYNRQVLCYVVKDYACPNEPWRKGHLVKGYEFLMLILDKLCINDRLWNCHPSLVCVLHLPSEMDRKIATVNRYKILVVIELFPSLSVVIAWSISVHRARNCTHGIYILLHTTLGYYNRHISAKMRLFRKK
jgi:hypothetical protein